MDQNEVPLPAAASLTGLVVPVILSGGSGTRLWPVSRESFPKQLWPLVSQRSLIQGDGAARGGAGLRGTTDRPATRNTVS